MTSLELHARHAPRHDGSEHGLGHVAHLIADTVREWHRRIHGRHELARLNDTMLKDIGITRAEAIELSSKPFWRR